MDNLKHYTPLVKSDGSKECAGVVLANADLILFYFSAHWCPPSREFTSALKAFYEELCQSRPGTSCLEVKRLCEVEIIFVSNDQHKSEMLSYMNEYHGDWFATEHKSVLSKQLEKKYGVDSLPTLVVCEKDGTVITLDGTTHVESMKPAEAVNHWKKYKTSPCTCNCTIM